MEENTHLFIHYLLHLPPRSAQPCRCRLWCNTAHVRVCVCVCVCVCVWDAWLVRTSLELMNSWSEVGTSCLVLSHSCRFCIWSDLSVYWWVDWTKLLIIFHLYLVWRLCWLFLASQFVFLEEWSTRRNRVAARYWGKKNIVIFCIGVEIFVIVIIVLIFSIYWLLIK